MALINYPIVHIYSDNIAQHQSHQGHACMQWKCGDDYALINAAVVVTPSQIF